MDSTAYYVGAAYYGSTGKHYLEDDGAEENGWQKRQNSTSNEQPVSGSEDTEYRILCPGAKIGSVIGKGGSVIKALRQECRSKIKVEDPVPGADERVIYICSTSTKYKDQGSVCPAQEALSRVHARIVDGSYEDDDEPPQPVTARLLVPHSQIGCLIGKGGRIIEQMRKEIGAQIRILPKEQLPACASSDDELVQITGEPALVRKALIAISSRLHDSPPRERSEGGVPLTSQGAGSMPFSGADGMYSAGGYMSQAGSLLAPTSLGGPLGGFGGYSFPPFGGAYGGAGVGSAWPMSSGPLMPAAIGSAGAKQQAEGSPEDELSIRVLCPNARIGSMIGKNGNVIKKMREETGAKIKVDDPVLDSDERVLHISAAEFLDSHVSPVIEATLQVFRRLVELQNERDKDNKSFSARLLVPSSHIGCLLGKGGTIISEMRKVTKANIRIPPKDELPKCAGESDELVQIMGDQIVVQDALVHVLNRLRNNLFKGREGASTGRFITPLSVASFGGSAMLPNYGGRYDFGSTGGMYSLTNMSLQTDHGFGGYMGGGAGGSGPPPSSSGGAKKPRRK